MDPQENEVQDENVLTEEKPFDLREFVANLPDHDEVEVEEGEGGDQVDVGPSTDEGALAEQTEPQDDTEEASEVEEDQAESEDEPEPQDNSEVEKLKELVQQQQADLNKAQQLLLQVIQEKQQTGKQPTKAEGDDLSEAVIKQALYGNLDELQGETKAKAQKFLTDYLDRTSRYAKDPALQYQEQFREHILRDVQQLIFPLVQQVQVSKVQSAFEQHVKDFTADQKARVGQLMRDMPGVLTTDEEVLRAFEWAANQVKSESQREVQAAESRKALAGKKQHAANKAAAASAAKQAAPSNDNTPRWDSKKETLAQFLRRIE